MVPQVTSLHGNESLGSACPSCLTVSIAGKHSNRLEGCIVLCNMDVWAEAGTRQPLEARDVVLVKSRLPLSPYRELVRVGFELLLDCSMF